ncbi:unnamed protein product, partial [Choristocarpus tenellus]
MDRAQEILRTCPPSMGSKDRGGGQSRNRAVARIKTLLQELKANIENPDPGLRDTLQAMSDRRPSIFRDPELLEAVCELLKSRASRMAIQQSRKEGPRVSQELACKILIAALRDLPEWPVALLDVYMHDALEGRQWVEHSSCKLLMDNLRTAWHPINPPRPPPHRPKSAPSPQLTRVHSLEAPLPMSSLSLTSPQRGLHPAMQQQQQQQQQTPGFTTPARGSRPPLRTGSVSVGATLPRPSSTTGVISSPNSVGTASTTSLPRLVRGGSKSGGSSHGGGGEALAALAALAAECSPVGRERVHSGASAGGGREDGGVGGRTTQGSIVSPVLRTSGSGAMVCNDEDDSSSEGEEVVEEGGTVGFAPSVPIPRQGGFGGKMLVSPSRRPVVPPQVMTAGPKFSGFEL